MKKYVAEAIGTFVLLFVGTGAIIVNDQTGGTITHVGIGLTFGLVVMSMIYCLGDISGAHINPAVTIGFWAAGRFAGRQVAPYIAAQLTGALLASGLLRVLFLDHETLGSTVPAGPWWQAVVFEILLTFILMLVILNVSTGAREKGIMAGAAIGGVVAFAAIFGGPISGASLNPARSLAPAVASLNIEHLWIYLLAPVVGALLAVPGCRCVQEEGCCTLRVVESPTNESRSVA